MMKKKGGAGTGKESRRVMTRRQEQETWRENLVDTRDQGPELGLERPELLQGQGRLRGLRLQLRRHLFRHFLLLQVACGRAGPTRMRRLGKELEAFFSFSSAGRGPWARRLQSGYKTRGAPAGPPRGQA